MPKLVNIGSMCIDLVYHVPDIARSGETIPSSGRRIFCGGKGLNQSLAAARAGAEVVHFGAAGEDGDLLLDALRDGGVDINGIDRLPGPSGHAVIQVNEQGQNAIVLSGGTNRQLPLDMVSRALGAMAPGDWLLLQNETNDVGRAISEARAAGMRVALNLAPPDQAAQSYPYGELDLLIVNEAEANALAGCESPESSFVTLLEKYPGLSVVLTRGHHGLLWFNAASGLCHHASAYQVTPVDETAAGDSFVGYLMAGLVRGDELDDCVALASAAGAMAVTRAGAAPSIPAPEEVAELRSAQADALQVREVDPGDLA